MYCDGPGKCVDAQIPLSGRNPNSHKTIVLCKEFCAAGCFSFHSSAPSRRGVCVIDHPPLPPVAKITLLAPDPRDNSIVPGMPGQDDSQPVIGKLRARLRYKLACQLTRPLCLVSLESIVVRPAGLHWCCCVHSEKCSELPETQQLLSAGADACTGPSKQHQEPAPDALPVTPFAAVQGVQLQGITHPRPAPAADSAAKRQRTSLEGQPEPPASQQEQHPPAEAQMAGTPAAAGTLHKPVAIRAAGLSHPGTSNASPRAAAWPAATWLPSSLATASAIASGLSIDQHMALPAPAAAPQGPTGEQGTPQILWPSKMISVKIP